MVRAVSIALAFAFFSCATFPLPEFLRSAGSDAARPAVSQAAFTVVAIPDTQYYSAQARGGLSSTFDLQTQWCVDQKVALKIGYIAHLGDVTDFGFLDEAQFDRAVKAWAPVVASGIPWTILPGNHEAYGALWLYRKENLSTYSRYFPDSLVKDKVFFGGSFPEGSLQNTYVLFEAGGLSWIGLSLGCLGFNGGEWDAQVVSWANAVLKRYPDRHAIVSTHDYLVEGGRDKAGQFLWDECISQNPNVFLVLCGHNVRQYRQVSYNRSGKPVLECLSDYQYDPRGGDGWLRYYQIDPARHTLTARTYSPLRQEFDVSPQGQFEADLPF